MIHEEAEAIRKQCQDQYTTLIPQISTPVIAEGALTQYSRIYDSRASIHASLLNLNDMIALADTAADISDKHYYIATHNALTADKKKNT